MQTTFFDYIRANWEGCIIDHPSQTQHECIMMSEEELLDRHIRGMLEDLRENKLEELLDAWTAETANNPNLRAHYRCWDICRQDIVLFLSMDLEQESNLETVKHLIMYY